MEKEKNLRYSQIVKVMVSIIYRYYNKPQRGSPQFFRLRRNMVSNSRAYTLFFTYLVKLNTAIQRNPSAWRGSHMMKRPAKSSQMASSLNRPCTKMGVRQGRQQALSYLASLIQLPCARMLNHATKIMNIWVERAAAPPQSSLVSSDGWPPLMSLGQASPE